MSLAIRLSVVLASFVVTAVLPSGASAAEVRIEGATLVYAAAPGELNRVIYTGAGQDEIALGGGIENGTLTAMAPCSNRDDIVVCPSTGLTSARIDLGDGDDRFSGSDASATAVLPSIVNGGDGADDLFGTVFMDTINGGPGPDKLGGGDGGDAIAGGAGADDINAGGGADEVDAGAGADYVAGGPGNDSILGGPGIERGLYGGAGDDTIDTRDGERENGGVACEEGYDTLLQDADDQIVEFTGSDGVRIAEPTCEQVVGGVAPRPEHVFQRNGRAGLKPLRLGIDLVTAFGGSYSIKVLMPKALVMHLHLGRKDTVIARGHAAYKAGHIQPRTQAKLGVGAKYVRALKRYGVVGFIGKVKITSTDTAGRTGAFSFRTKLYKSVFD